MTERATPGKPSVMEIAQSLAYEFESEMVETYGRFSMSRHNSKDIILSTFDRRDKKRFLITDYHDDADIYDALSTDQIVQFPRKDAGPAAVLYTVTLHAKPLDHERLFLTRASSETYVSDNELFFQVGELWARIYQACKKLPREAPMSRTSLLDWEPETMRLVPVPPYDDFQDMDSPAQAFEHFRSTLVDELQRINPRQSYTELLEAVSVGWNNQQRPEIEAEG